MFRVFDAKSRRKIDNVILSSEMPGGNISTISINDQMILEMPDTPTGQYSTPRKRELDAAMNHITFYFKSRILSQIKDNYYESMMRHVTGNIPRVQQILLHRLEQNAQNYQINGELAPDLLESRKCLYDFLIENELTRDDAKHLRTLFNTQRNWNAEMMAMPIDKLMPMISEIYHRRWKDRPEYTRPFTRDDIDSVVVCKGVWI